jgi:hypothetical protein
LNGTRPTARILCWQTGPDCGGLQRMKRIFFLAFVGMAAVFALTSCCGLKQCSQCSGGAAIELFNGKDINGWDYALADAAVPRDAVWSVKDGLLICKGTPIGVLYSQRKFTNFRAVV